MLLELSYDDRWRLQSILLPARLAQQHKMLPLSFSITIVLFIYAILSIAKHIILIIFDRWSLGFGCYVQILASWDLFLSRVHQFESSLQELSVVFYNCMIYWRNIIIGYGFFFVFLQVDLDNLVTLLASLFSSSSTQHYITVRNLDSSIQRKLINERLLNRFSPQFQIDILVLRTHFLSSPFGMNCFAILAISFRRSYGFFILLFLLIPSAFVLRIGFRSAHSSSNQLSLAANHLDAGVDAPHIYLITLLSFYGLLICAKLF